MHHAGGVLRLVQYDLAKRMPTITRYPKELGQGSGSRVLYFWCKQIDHRAQPVRANACIVG